MKLGIKQLIFSAAIVTLGISSALAMKPDIVSEKKDVTSDDFFIVGKNENGEYKILIPSELMKVSILFKKAKMAESSTKEITAPEEVEESDIRSFFKMFEKGETFNKDDLNETNIVSTIYLANYFNIPPLFMPIAKAFVEKAKLENIKKFFKNEEVPLYRKFFIAILKELLVKYQEKVIGDLTELTGEKFSLAEVNEIKSLVKRNCIFNNNEYVSLLAKSNLFCTLKDINNLSEILKLNKVKLEKVISFSLNNNGNKIKDIEPLKDLKKLKKLLLPVNKIKNIEPLKYLPKLEELNLSTNEIKNIEPLKHLKKLSKLNLDRNDIDDFSPIENLTDSLRFFNFSENPGSPKGDHLDKLVSHIIKNNKVEIEGDTVMLRTDLFSFFKNNAPNFFKKVTFIKVRGSDTEPLKKLPSSLEFKLEEGVITLTKQPGMGDFYEEFKEETGISAKMSDRYYITYKRE